MDLVVGDGTRQHPYIVLWRRNGDRFEGPRRLGRHRGSWHIQAVHIHPRLSPDGRQVHFTADPNGYGNLFLVDISEFDSLPPAA